MPVSQGTKKVYPRKTALIHILDIIDKLTVHDRVHVLRGLSVRLEAEERAIKAIRSGFLMDDSDRNFYYAVVPEKPVEEGDDD
jgi:hypothetical protein